MTFFIMTIVVKQTISIRRMEFACELKFEPYHEPQRRIKSSSDFTRDIRTCYRLAKHIHLNCQSYANYNNYKHA